MKKILLSFVAVLISISGFAQTPHKFIPPPAISEGSVYGPFPVNTVYSTLPSFSPDMLTDNAQVVPFRRSFTDYQTNGTGLSMIYVSGDTVIVGQNYVDSLDAPNANAGTVCRIAYNISYDGGVTWASTTGYDMSNNKSRWADLYMVTIGGFRTAVTGGRFFDAGNSATRHAGVSYDALLGIGSPTVTLMGETSVGNSDCFIHTMPNGLIACAYEPNNTDSMVFRTFDPATNSFGTRRHLFQYSPALSNVVAAYQVGSSMSGNHLTYAYSYVNEPSSGGDPLRSYRVQTSVDNGATWTSPTKVLGNGVINGDSVQPYWHIDIGYKPGTTTPYMVFPTFDYTSEVDPSITRKSWKIIMQSPAVNGGNPVVVTDWNDPKIHILNNVSEYTQLNDRVSNAGYTPYQVNAAYLSHPSIGFSQDGSVIYVAYSVIQTDSINGGIAGRYYNPFDVYLSASTDGGTTWTTKNVTNTPNIDEMYPVVSETGNTNTKAKLIYHSTTVPGSSNFGQDFNPQSAVAAVFTIFNDCDKPVGVVNISTEVPQGFKLGQNYPNPFNPSTSIRFELPKSAVVSLKVYDITGKEVATLVNNENVKAGINEVSFDAQSLTSGIYFYTLVSDNFKETKKMILMK